MKYKCFCHREDFKDLTEKEIRKMLYSFNRFTPEEFIIHYGIGEKDFHIMMYKFNMMSMISKARYHNVKTKGFLGIYLSEETVKSFNLPKESVNLKESVKVIKHIKPRMPKEIKRELRKMPKAIINEVKKIYNNECAVCGTKEHLTIHHILPVSEGGDSLPSNLQLLCADHHAEAHKGDREYHMLKSRARKLKEGLR